MGKNLLFLILLFFAYLLPTSGLAQCPTSVSISANPGTTICSGTSVTFTATPTPTSGTTLTYDWIINSSSTPAQSGPGNTFTPSSLSNSDKIKVVVTLTDNTYCATSNILTMTVNPKQTPAVNISANKTSICPAENVTFTATPINGGSSSSYEWFINSNTTSTQSGLSNTFITGNFVTGINTVKVKLTTSLTCITTSTAEATSANITLHSDKTIVNNPNKDGTTCINTTLTPIVFSTTGSPSGMTVSGLPSGITGVYSSSDGKFTISGTPTQSGSFNYTISTTGTCNQDTVNGVIDVDANDTISLTSGNNTQTLCADESLINIIYNTGGSATDASVTGLPSGINGAFSNNTFTISGFSSSTGTFNYTVTTLGTCTPTDLSGTITILPNLVPAVSISSSDADNIICEGTSVTFTATPTNGGSTPQYIWKLNGTIVGSNSPAYTNTSLTNGQSVSVEMISSEQCVQSPPPISTPITTTVNLKLVPSVTITSNDSDDIICSGTSVTFTATPINGGSNPQYIWKLNGSTVGSNSPTYTNPSLPNGQTVTVNMISSETCLSTTTASSNSITTAVNPNLTPSVTIASNDSDNIICSGSSITFNATPTNEGPAPTYQWYIGTTPSGTGAAFTTSSLTNGQQVSVVMTSNAACLATTTATSNNIAIQVDSSITNITPSFNNTNPSHNSTAICPVVSGLIYNINSISGATSYIWNFPSGWTITSGSNTNIVTVTATLTAQAGTITVRGKNECGQTQPVNLQVTTGTVAYASAGPDQTVCIGTNSITLAGDIGGVITQKKDWNWSASVSGGSFSNGGANLTGTYDIPTNIRNNGGTVTITITTVKPQGTCPAKVDDMIITVVPNATINNPANKNQTVCINTAIAAINFQIGGAGNGATVSGLPAGITGNYSNGIFTLTGTPTASGTFNYTVNTTGACPQTSQTGTITVTPNPTISNPSNKNQTVCINSAINAIDFTITAPGTGATSTGLPQGVTGNFNAGIYKLSGTPTQTGTFNYTINTTGSCVQTSQTGTLIVNPNPTINNPAIKDQTTCINIAIEPISFSITAPGTGATVSGLPTGLNGVYNGGVFTISGTPTSTVPNPYTYNYTVTTTGLCTQASQTGTITVLPNPTISDPSNKNQTICINSAIANIGFNISAPGTGATVTGLPSGLAGNFANGIYTVSGTASIAGTFNYTLTTTGSCLQISQSGTITVTSNPTINNPANKDQAVCINSTIADISFNITAPGTGATVTGLPTGLSGSFANGIFKISGTPTSSLQDPYIYNYTVTTTGTCTSTTQTGKITVYPLSLVDAGIDQLICSSGNATMAGVILNGSSTGNGIWTSNGSGSFVNSNSPSAEYIPSGNDIGNGSVTLTYTSTDHFAPCSAISDSMLLTINEEIVITEQPSNLGICSTNPASFSVTASGDNLTYQWYKDNVLLNGKTSAILSYNNATSNNAGDYHVVVSGGSGCEPVLSTTVTLNVDENIIIEEPVTEVPICGDGFSTVTMKFIAHANGAPLTFTWYKGGVAVDADSDVNITITTGDPDVNGKYEGTLELSNITTDYNGDYHVEINGPVEFTCSTAVTNPFQLRLDEVPDEPETATITYCQGDIASPLSAIDIDGNTLDPTTLKWYATEFGDDIFTGTPTPSTNSAVPSSYWVSQTPDVCESPRARIDVIVNPKPPKPTLDPNTIITYCLDESPTQLVALGENGASFNWYDILDSTTPLNSPPTLVTSQVGTIDYWVSQISTDGCESNRLQVTITVNPLPILTVSATNSTICSGTHTTLNASNSVAGATSYLWTVDGTPIAESTKASPTVNPTATTTYLVTGTSDKGCTSTAEVTVTVDQPSSGGSITPSSTAVCVSGNSGTLSIAGSGYLGQIVRWESSVNNGSNWTPIVNTSQTYNFTNLTQTTKFRAVVKNGVCTTEAFSAESTITVDPIPIGGKLLFSNLDRIYLTCETPTESSLSAISLSGHSGTVVAWKYRRSSASTWTTIQTSGTTLTAADIYALGVNETMVFQVEISSGTCTQNALSQTAILSVIPSDIEPTPVSIDPDVICFGEQVTLHSSTGYGNPLGEFEGGAFDNAGIISKGWRVYNSVDPTDTGFDTDANNTRPDRWKRATRHQFTTANINSPFTTREDLYISSGGPTASGNKGFAVVSSNNIATIETPVFAIGGIDQAILTWDQMYNLTPGASIKVEISTDGGNTYNNILYSKSTPPNPPNTTGISSGNYDGFSLGTIATRPNNKMKVDLGYYMGQQNLRIRFNYIGKRLGDVWAIDNISIPDGPRGVSLVWYDYTDPANPIYIGNSETETWTPSKIGYNEFEVRTKLLLDSSGTSCQSIENYQRVSAYAYDTYTSSASAVVGTCGNLDVQLTGTILGAHPDIVAPVSVNPDGNFPLGDISFATWEVVSGPAGYTYSFTPGVNTNVTTFTPNLTGDYVLRYAITKDPNSPCTVTNQDITFTIPDCTTLDFDGVDDYVDLGITYTETYSIEAWIRPFDRSDNLNAPTTDASTGTIISGPNFEIKMEDLPATIIPNTRWYHVAVSNGKLYIDGIDSGISGSGTGGDNTLIGARWNNTSGEPENYFSGWIEEVRIWNTAITQDQIRFMMNQHLQNAGNMGVEIPMPVPGGLVYGDLAGYYRLISRDPDPANLVTFDPTLLPANGLTPDLANNAVPGRLNNMITDQKNTAPLPYISAKDGQLWATDDTWLRPAVWDAPNSKGIDNTSPIDWNIVRINHNINSGDRDITVLGLKSETSDKLLNITGPGPQDEYNPGQMLRVTHYLLLNGNIDLVGESQLLQDSGSILNEASAGYLERDQQGKRNSFVYNYWSSSVSPQGAGANNAPYSVKSVLMDGTTASNPQTIIFDARYWIADWGRTTPIITISTYWLWGYSPATANIYAEWDHILENGTLETGEGFTMKGTDGTASIGAEQNYTFRGKPHNGDFDLSMAAGQNYLIGNPYPSAMDADEFIRNNLNDVVGGTNGTNVFDGALYFWDHFQEVDHILKEYIGGYATYNLSGGVPAISNDARINANDALGIKYPGQYIPVAQAFLINSSNVNAAGVTIIGGNIHFKNSQRIFKREQLDDSQFLKPETTTKTNNQKTQEKSKIRISFKSPVGYHRQILVGAIPSTTNGFDLGYDALLFDDNVEDMYWLQGDNQLVIQGVPNFDKDQVLPLGVKIKENKEFRIRIDTLENTPAEMKVYLNDKLKDSIHDLKAGAYVSTSEPGYIHDRFEIIFFKDEPPVVEGPIVGDPVVDVPIIEDPQTDFTTLSIKHAHNLREIQIMNPDRLIITSVYLFDLNGNLIENYTNIPDNQEINLRVRNYSSGVYLLKVYAEGKIISKKIIISN